MITYILTDRINKKIARDYSGCFFISHRRLSRREVQLIHEFNFRRMYLSKFDDLEKEGFYREFDRFWNELIRDFGPQHVFWRNAVSSKMQEGSQSISYFVLLLWTLKNIEKKNSFSLVVICENVEEVGVFSLWASQNGLKLVRTISWWQLFSKRISQEFWNLGKFFYFTYLCFKKKRIAPKISLENFSPMDKRTLVVSEFYSHSISNGKYQHPCWGPLYQFFSEQNQKFSILGDTIDVPSPAIRNDLEAAYRSFNLFYLYSLVGWWTIIKVSLRVFFRRISIGPCFFDGCDLAPLVRWHLRRFNYPFNINAEIFFEGVKRINQGQFQRMLITFEDNLFERACIQAFCALNKQGVVEGYSHGMICPFNMKLYLTDQEKDRRPQCDRYLTCGDYASKLLSVVACRPSQNIISACTFRSIPIFKYEDLQAHAKDVILVAFDGFYNAAQQFDWLVENKEAFGNYRVVLRAHPNVPWEYIFRHSLYALPEGFEISKEDLKKEFSRTFCVVYRSASIGLQAVLNGIPAIHMCVDLPLEGDPMYELNQLKWVVHNSEELKKALIQIKELSVQENEEARLKATKFAEEYFSPMTEHSIKPFFEWSIK